jgi:hypothetical protein
VEPGGSRLRARDRASAAGSDALVQSPQRCRRPRARSSDCGHRRLARDPVTGGVHRSVNLGPPRADQATSQGLAETRPTLISGSSPDRGTLARKPGPHRDQQTIPVWFARAL